MAVLVFNKFKKIMKFAKILGFEAVDPVLSVLIICTSL